MNSTCLSPVTTVNISGAPDGAGREIFITMKEEIGSWQVMKKKGNKRLPSSLHFVLVVHYRSLYHFCITISLLQQRCRDASFFIFHLHFEIVMLVGL